MDMIHPPMSETSCPVIGSIMEHEQDENKECPICANEDRTEDQAIDAELYEILPKVEVIDLTDHGRPSPELRRLTNESILVAQARQLTSDEREMIATVLETGVDSGELNAEAWLLAERMVSKTSKGIQNMGDLAKTFITVLGLGGVKWSTLEGVLKDVSNGFPQIDVAGQTWATELLALLTPLAPPAQLTKEAIHAS